MRLRSQQSEQQRRHHLEQQAAAVYREQQELLQQQEQQQQQQQLHQQQQHQWEVEQRRQQASVNKHPDDSISETSPVSVTLCLPGSSRPAAAQSLAMPVPVSADRPPKKPRRHARFSENGSCHALLDFADMLGGFKL